MSELHSVPGIERRLWSYCGCYFVGKFLFSVLNTPRKRMFRFTHFQFRLVNLGRHHPCLLQHHEPLIVKPLEHGSTARRDAVLIQSVGGNWTAKCGRCQRSAHEKCASPDLTVSCNSTPTHSDGQERVQGHATRQAREMRQVSDGGCCAHVEGVMLARCFVQCSAHDECEDSV